MGRRLHRDTDSEDEENDAFKDMLRFTCKEPHSELCPFNICRNADRYLPFATQRGKNTQDLRLADFSCSFRYDAPLADALARRREKKKEEQEIADGNLSEHGFICRINGCHRTGTKTFDTRANMGKGNYIEHICEMHYKRLKRSKNRLSALWTAAELRDDPGRRCSYEQKRTSEGAIRRIALIPPVLGNKDESPSPSSAPDIVEEAKEEPRKMKTRGNKITVHQSLISTNKSKKNLERPRVKRPDPTPVKASAPPKTYVPEDPWKSLAGSGFSHPQKNPNADKPADDKPAGPRISFAKRLELASKKTHGDESR